MEPESTFAKPKRGRYILCIVVGLVIVLLVAAVVVLTILLVRDKSDGDDGGQRQNEVRMSFLFVESHGIVNNSLEASVVYQAPEEHTTDWFIRYRTGDLYRTAGIVWKLGYNATVFATNITIPDIIDTTYIRLQIHSMSKSISIHFDDRAKPIPGYAQVPAWRSEIIHIDNNVIAPINTNLSIDVTVKLDPFLQEGLRNYSQTQGDEVNIKGVLEVFYDGLNTSAEKSVVFEIFGGYSETNCIYVPETVTINHGTIQLTINIGAECTQFGGLLQIGINEPSFIEYVRRISQIVFIKILSPVSNDVVPENTVGVYPLNKETFIFLKRSTLFCFAMGNPTPSVSLYKVNADSREYLLTTAEELITAEYKHLMGYTIGADEQVNEGKYICRAKSGQATSETFTEVIFGETSVIDTTATGVAENTTEKISIKCQASGVPRPSFELRLFDEYGPDLMKAGIYQVNQSFPDRKTSTVILTISPPEPAISTVYCVTLPEDIQNGIAKIEVFPVEPWDFDWEFYNRISDLVYGRITTSDPNSGT